jgi:hypothetical protein
MTEITGYLAKRQWDIGPPSRRYNQAEQTSIARDIAAPLADVGVDIVTEPGPGFPRDREYEFMESEHRLRLLENLSNVIEGPEYRTEYRMTTQGQPRATLRIAYPRVGTGEAGLGLIVPGEALDFGAAWDADKLRTRTFAVGELPEDAPEGTLRPVVVRDVPQNDLPRLDEADDYPGVILVSTLTERAAAESVRQGSPALQLQLAVPEAAPPLLAYGPGDDVTIRVTTPLLSGGLEVDGALTEIEVDAATGKTTWTVVIGLPPPRPRESLMARLNRIDYVTRGTFRRRLEAL